MMRLLIKKRFKNFLFLFFLAVPVSAYALEAKYPNIPFLPQIYENSKLPAYIGYFFGLGIYIAGMIAVVSFAAGAVQLILSAGSPEARTNATDKIKGSVLGLILIMASFIILKTINPVLVSPSLTSLGEVPGVFYTNGTDLKPAPFSESDTANIPEGYSKIIYKCAKDAYSPPLYIWKFPELNFKGNDGEYAGITVAEKKCGEEEPISETGSFKMAFKTPGIYYFLGDNCSGYMSGPNLSDQSAIEKPFSENIKSIKIINEPENSIFWGIIFHEKTDLKNGGPCDVPRMSGRTEECIKIQDDSAGKSIATNAASIFKLNENPAYSGKGIDFYSDPYGWTAGSWSGYYKVTNDQIKEAGFVKNARAMDFNYAGIMGALAENCRSKPQCGGLGYGKECCPCKTFQNCFGSIKIRGNYLVALYSFDLNSASGLYCQTFYKDIVNLKATDIAATQNNINYVNIIPLKR